MGGKGCARREALPRYGCGSGMAWMRDENCPSLVLKEVHPEDSDGGSGQGRRWLDARCICH